MYYDRKKYEDLISASPLFSLNGATETAAYKREFYKMTEYLYCYLLSINEREYEPYGCEIMETAVRCIHGFDSEKGVFLHYFRGAWKKEYRRILAGQASDQKFRGMKITEDDRRNIRKYLNLAGMSGAASDSGEVYRKIAQAMDIPVEKVREIAQMSEVTVSGGTAMDDGEEVDIWERISDGASFEQELIAEDQALELLCGIEAAFSGLQNRQKAVVSDVLTSRLYAVLPDLRRAAGRFGFISRDVLNACAETGAVPTQHSIAQKYGRDEASVSRTVNGFLKKAKNKIYGV